MRRTLWFEPVLCVVVTGLLGRLSLERGVVAGGCHAQQPQIGPEFDSFCNASALGRRSSALWRDSAHKQAGFVAVSASTAHVHAVDGCSEAPLPLQRSPPLTHERDWSGCGAPCYATVMLLVSLGSPRECEASVSRDSSPLLVNTTGVITPPEHAEMGRVYTADS